MRARISAFAAHERQCVGEQFNNSFAFSVGQFARYYEFLEIVEQRYRDASSAFTALNAAYRETLRPGVHRMTRKQESLRQQQLRAGELLGLEVESFYLFAKILLDRVTAMIEYYFRPGHITGSHRKLMKQLGGWAEAGGLVLPQGLLEAGRKLQEGISDLRDKRLVHDKSPHTTRGFTWDASGRVSIAISQLVVSRTDEPADEVLKRANPQQTQPLGELLHEIEGYVGLTLRFIETNRDKTALR